LKICVAQPAFLSSGADGRGMKLKKKWERAKEREREREREGKKGDRKKMEKRDGIVCERRW
jgi:hypothetical protein